jgi:hypothetical protein
MRMQLWRIIWATHVEWFDKLKKLYKILIKHRKEEIIWKAQLYIGWQHWGWSWRRQEWVVSSIWLIPVRVQWQARVNTAMDNRVSWKATWVFFLWRRAPQQMLRTHHSLKAYCATCDEDKIWSVSSFFPSNGTTVEWNLQGKTEVLGEKTCPSATLSTINPTRTDPGSNPSLCGETHGSYSILTFSFSRKILLWIS